MDLEANIQHIFVHQSLSIYSYESTLLRRVFRADMHVRIVGKYKPLAMQFPGVSVVSIYITLQPIPYIARSTSRLTRYQSARRSANS